MNFGKSLLLLSLGIIIGVSGTGITNYIANNILGDPNIPYIGDKSKLQSGLDTKLNALDKLTCAERYQKFEDIYKILGENYYSTSGISFDELLEGGLHGFVGGDIRFDVMNRLSGRLIYAKVNQSAAQFGDEQINLAFPEDDKIKALDVTWTHYLKPTLPLKINGWMSDSDRQGNDGGVSVGIEIPLDRNVLGF